MSLNSLYIDAFYACAQAGHFTKAAKSLNITQSALSQRIKNLELELGTTLFIREKTGVRLTEFGEKLVRYCRAKDAAELELVQQVRNEAKGELTGVIRVGTFSSVGRSLVLPSLAKLLSRNPSLQFKMVTRELYELTPMLRSGEIDFLITTSQAKIPGVVAATLGHEHNVLIQKRGYKGPDVYLDHDESDRTTTEYFKKDLKQIRRRYLDDIYGIIDGVQLGIGKAVVPSHLIDSLRDIEIVNPSRTLTNPVVLHYYEQSLYSSLHKAVIEQLTSINFSEKP